MNHATARILPRIYFYVLFLVVGLAGLMYEATTISSSHSLAAATGSRETSAINETNRHSINLGGSYRAISSPLLGEIKLLAAQTPAAKIGSRVLRDTADGKSTSVVILLADQADVSAAETMKDQDARGWYVYNTLTQHAARTQVDLQEFLKTQGVTYQSFWAANMLVATADRQLVEVLAARADVARVDSNKPTRWIENPEVAKFGVTTSGPNAPTVVEAGVTNVNAPAVWALGFTGQGIVIGNQDTGTRWDHNALKPKYRGWNGVTADHNFNWHDSIHSGGGSCGANTVIPCDDQGHGTHTTGTTVGDDGTGNQVGVAPGAKWIGCRNMDQGNGTPATYTECFQFFIAPTDLAGNNPNAALRPHVINNSWSCPVSEGCTTGTELQTIVNNTQAAGIFVVVSAGNSGSACSTVQDAPAFYDASFSVGAISSTTNTLASFSSRGPGTLAPNLLKPNISAPGVSVRSTTRTSISSFGSMSGTSMAGPHVAGVVALLWSARPYLLNFRNVAETKTILQNTANPDVTVSPAQTCGGTLASTPGLSQIPNNSFGYGRVDALAAYNASAPTAAGATISGSITTPDGSPLSGVTVQLSGPTTTKAITDDNGVYRFDNVDTQNFYTVTPARVNYSFNPGDRSFTLTENKTDAIFTATPDASVSANPIDTAEYFVRQHYLDFLGREPDHGGFNFWSDQITACGNDVGCTERRRINVSAAYFLSIEFQQTGYLVYRMYKAANGNLPSGAPVPVRFGEFLTDTRQISQGVVVGVGNWQTQLENNKVAFAQDFVSRSAFIAKHPTSFTPAQFVDALFANGGVTPTDAARTAAIDEFGGAGNTADSAARARALRRVAENATLSSQELNRAFVLMQYFGYLRRNPYDPPEPTLDYAGYSFWLNKLNQFNGNFEQAEMVEAFITSGEYRARFPR